MRGVGGGADDPFPGWGRLVPIPVTILKPHGWIMDRVGNGAQIPLVGRGDLGERADPRLQRFRDRP
jgi:hypothetical protein